MNSLQRVLLTAILGALIVTSIGVAFGQSSATPAAPGPIRILNQGALRSNLPEMDAPPPNNTRLYTPEFWIAEAEVEKWRQRYATPVLVVLPAAIDRPVYTLSGDGAATAVAVVPMHGLWLRRAAIAAGQVLWAPLDDAYAALTAPPPASDKAAAEALQRARETLAQTRQTIDAALARLDP